MKAVGIKVLKNRLSEFVRLAAGGETVLVTDRDRVVAELGPPRPQRSAVLADDRTPGEGLWRHPLVSSRLLEYEVWVRLHARKLVASHGGFAQELLSRVALVELAPEVLRRALEPFPFPVRTLDAIHLASADFVRRSKQKLTIATYDQRLAAAARALGFSLHDLTDTGFAGAGA